VGCQIPDVDSLRGNEFLKSLHVPFFRPTNVSNRVIQPLLLVAGFVPSRACISPDLSFCVSCFIYESSSDRITGFAGCELPRNERTIRQDHLPSPGLPPFVEDYGETARQGRQDKQDFFGQTRLTDPQRYSRILIIGG
jgi:hypothetical protein